MHVMMLRHIVGGLLNAFTSKPFGGNPCAVILTTRALTLPIMQNFARDLNLPTTFLVREEDDVFSIRWIFPSGHEDQLCGHGALCAAKFLYLHGETSGDSLEMKTNFDLSLHADILDDGSVELGFPYITTTQLDMQTFSSEMRSSLDLESANVLYFGKSKYDYLIEVEGDSIVRNLSPDFKKLSTFQDARAFIVTAENLGPGDFNFVSRVFGPRMGINEDRVTGSAHCTLAPHWRRRSGINDMMGYQASDAGGFVECNHDGGDTVLIRGNVTPMWDFKFEDFETNYGLDIGLH